ncbi:MAG: undecaprenyl/decaprenyl-phosphate alpha-N-acetylglucosaminyl 1-phosphate transferase [Planctomycetota bacterium]|nr:undecaprenyl/decaprenyl-phosphate alpha-N-acetylglucosaminyl 1-phosphate transferase [Planctomycetota bacterium]
MFPVDAVALVAGGFAVSLAAMPVCIRAAKHLGLLDSPGHRKEQEVTVPLLGGVGIFAGILLPVGLHSALRPDAILPADRARIWTALAASLALAAAGLADDRRPMSPRVKFAAQAAVATIFAWFGYRFDFLQLPGLPPLNLYPLAVPFTAIWIVAVVNGFNLIDGSDGLAGSVAATAAVTVALCGARAGDTAALSLGAACAGASLGFLLFNWKPARVYMGDAGSQGIGMLAAAMLVSLGQDRPAFMRDPILSEGSFVDYHVPLATAAAVYPLLEAALSAVRRVLAGRPVGRADLGHIHHRLKAAGWSPQWIAAWAAAATASSGAGIVLMFSAFRGLSVWFFLLTAFLLTAALGLGGCLDALHPSGIRGARPRHALVERFAAMQKARLDLAATAGDVWRALEEACVEFGIETYRAFSAAAGRGGTVRSGTESPAPGTAVPPPASGAAPARSGPIPIREWRRPPGAKPEHLILLPRDQVPRAISDMVASADGGTWIEWTGESRWIGRDLEVDCRTVFSELARHAIEKIRELPPVRDGSPPDL